MMLSPEEKRKIELKIASVEKLTTAEFKVIIAKSSWLGIKRKAKKLFKKYHLHKTKERNAVLLLILEADRQLLIYGDEGIHEKVGDGYWDLIRDKVLLEFKQANYVSGIAIGIHLIADILIEHFPSDGKENLNEISNEIIFEK